MAVYLITGASSGIGKNIARTAIKRGHVVFGLARRKNLLDALEKELGDKFTGIVCDVTDKKVVHDVCESLPALPDVCILNAGVGEFDASDCFDVSVHERVMAVNYFGALYFIHELFPKFVERKSGTFAGVASLAAHGGLPMGIAYCASKAALSNGIEAMRVTYRTQGIRFVTVHPGFVRTPMTEVNDFPMPFAWTAEKAGEYILNGIEKGKWDISFPWPIRLSIGLGRLLPKGLYRAMVKG